VIDVARRLSWPNALKTYGTETTEVGRGSENDNGGPGEDRHGHRCDDAVCGAVGDALAARTTEERCNASVRLIRLVEAARARASFQAGYFAPLAVLMNASRLDTSFTSITASGNGRDKHSKGPFVHVIHGPATPAHKATIHKSSFRPVGGSAGDRIGPFRARRRRQIGTTPVRRQRIGTNPDSDALRPTCFRRDQHPVGFLAGLD